MVKFGRHQKFFLENEHPDIFVVPYNDAKAKIESDFISADDFESQWCADLKRARMDFDDALQRIWRQVFQNVSNNCREVVEEGRGASPEKALVLFAQHAPAEEVQDVLSTFKRLHATALVNAEALRKLVKKFDKKHKKGDNSSIGEIMALSCKLLPEVYAANFVIGLTALHQGIELLRSELNIGEYADADVTGEDSTSPMLQSDSGSPTSMHYQSAGQHFVQHYHHDSEASIGMTIDDQDFLESALSAPSSSFITNDAARDDAEEEHTFTKLTRHDRKDSHTEHLLLVDKRKEELHWLQQSVQRLRERNMLSHLVAHRGFHSPLDRSDKRPMENSLQAYESAWTSGIHLCECDVALTKDERLILAHDENFCRLALDTSNERSSRKVGDLTFPEIMSVALKSGSRPPLLLDVLQSAHAIGGGAQLVIEIKPGNREAASALARMFGQHPHLMAHCAVVMSFDSFVMHSLQDEMDAIFGTTGESEDGSGTKGHRRVYSMGLLPVPSLTALDVPHSPLATPQDYTRPKLLVLTVSDEPNNEVELQVSIGEEDPLEKIHDWTKRRLDGVYMQFEPHMVTPEGAAALKRLAQGYSIGIWGYNGRDPDHYDTFAHLVNESRVSFVNTDLPREFFLASQS